MGKNRIPFPKNVFEFACWFPDDKACTDYLYQSRWPESFVCPKCGSTEDPYMLDKYKRIECSSCGHQTSVTAGTVLHRTRMPLTMWFEAAYHVATDVLQAAAVLRLHVLPPYHHRQGGNAGRAVQRVWL